MSKDERIKIFKATQDFYSQALADHVTLRKPTVFQQSLQERLFVGFNRVKTELAALL